REGSEALAAMVAIPPGLRIARSGRIPGRNFVLTYPSPMATTRPTVPPMPVALYRAASPPARRTDSHAPTQTPATAAASTSTKRTSSGIPAQWRSAPATLPPSSRNAPVDAETTPRVTIQRPRRAGSGGRPDPVRACLRARLLRWRMSPLVPGSTSDKGFELPPQVGDLVPQPSGVLETELLGRLVHLLLERLDQPGEFLAGHHRGLGLGAPLAAVAAASLRHRGLGADRQEDVGDILANGMGIDALLGVVAHLDGPPAVGLGDRSRHGA